MGNLTEWSNIVESGASGIASFGDRHAEFEAARSAAVVMPATQFSTLLVHGAEAAQFLQGQVTCDVGDVSPERAQFGGYCTPKGRLLANFLLVAVPQGFLVYLPADVASGLAERLRKFVLRSKVRIEPESGWRAIGLAGPSAEALLQREVRVLPKSVLAVAASAGARIVRLPGEIFLVLTPVVEATVLWDRLSGQARPAGDDCWAWLQIHNGMPWITAPTQDQFLPQMVGLDEIGGVSFEKGCYAGQEIVARARYLGEVKRGLRRAQALSSVRAGEALTYVDGQPGGIVLNAVDVPDAESELLAVVTRQADPNVGLMSAGGSKITLVPAAAPAD